MACQWRFACKIFGTIDPKTQLKNGAFQTGPPQIWLLIWWFRFTTASRKVAVCRACYRHMKVIGDRELIYVTSQGSQLQWKHLNTLEKFCTALFCMSCECDFFWHGESMDRNHSACFSKPFCWFGRSVRRSVRLSVVPSGPRSELCGRLECL